MASNGGTLHGVPQSVSQQQQQQQQQQHICSQCGLYFESASSLQVHHMHYHQHDSMNRWGSSQQQQQQQQPVVSTTLATTAVATTTTAATITTNGSVVPSSTTPTSSDTENNNQPGSLTPTGGLKPVASPQQQQQQQHHTTIAAAADSSDNQPPTPQPTITEPGTPQSYSGGGGGGTSPYHTQQHQQQQQQQQQQVSQHQLGLPSGAPGSEMHYPSYIHPGAYDYAYAGGPGLDYGGGGVLGAPLQPTDYKSSSSVVSSARYHPYGGPGSNGPADGSSPAVVSSNGSAGMSPQVVSSSNGVSVAGSGSAGAGSVTTVASTTSHQSQSSHSPQNGTGGSNIPPTPSPSPIQCEKCGLVCESDEALNEHEATVHSSVPVQSAQDQQQQQQQQQQRVDQVDLQTGGGANCYPYGGGGGTPGYPVKEETPASDILDLDSQKMVGYGAGADGGLLPPMNSLHPLQSMQRHPMMAWPHHDPHNFMGPPPPLPPPPHHAGADMKHSAAAAAAAAAAYYHHPIKSEYSATPSIKSEYLGGGGVGGGGHYGAPGGPMVKNEYSLAPTLPPPAVAPQATNPQSMKQYADEMHDNQLATSPSDFPSTTTPQESGSQYRTFEPATSSLPGTGSGPTKGTAWKSNEARRPKTYNCTACNKWFTSSGHLKRHYNTTLHKNAVKSSGQPDPATLPISVHHHPGRDPNYANKGRRGGTGNGGAGGSGGGGGGAGGGGSQLQQTIQQPVPPPDPPRSPEYGAAGQQYAGAGFPAAGTSPGQQQHHPGGGQLVSTNQSAGFHHPYAGATSANGGSTSASSSTSSAVPPNGVAGPSVQVSQPRGLQIYSNSSSSSMAEQMEQATHTITTILTPTTQQPICTAGIPDIPGTTICTGTRTPGTPGTRTPPTMGMGSPQPPPHHLQQRQQQPPPQQQLPPPTISSMEPYHHHHHHHMHTMHTHISNPLTISTTSIPSFQTILPEAPSYHLIIGNGSQYHPGGHQLHQPAGDGGQWADLPTDGTEGLIESTTGGRTPLGFPRCAGGAEVYQGDTAPPFSPNVPEQYHQQRSGGGEAGLPIGMTMLHDGQLATESGKYKDYLQSEVDPYQEQLLYRVATPQLGATAPSISPAPCSPSVTSTDVGQTQLGRARGQKAGHNGSASGQPPEVHRCIECDKVFNKVCYLTQHNKTFHSGDKPYKCHRCGKRFPCNQSYEEHLAKHGGEKPFKCEQCPKQFNHKTDLRRHMCLHSGSKPYACEQCGKGFIRKDHMMKHAETHRKNAAAAAAAAGHDGPKRPGKGQGGIKGGGRKIVGLMDE
ncbi:trithorax group protein osa-like [Anopheles merus]|uniref:C2H2-type domain-containing protein n=1 Tax=Anopheles merus TaxID=30066 RepID=A0A182VLL1_ANOME|nr:trithorax group protein osa-like [Anopheles merus]